MSDYTRFDWTMKRYREIKQISAFWRGLNSEYACFQRILKNL